MSPTFLLKDKALVEALEERSCKLFGKGLNVLGGPLTFVYWNWEKSVAHCCTLFGKKDPSLTGASAAAESSVARLHKLKPCWVESALG